MYVILYFILYYTILYYRRFKLVLRRIEIVTILQQIEY